MAVTSFRKLINRCAGTLKTNIASSGESSIVLNSGEGAAFGSTFPLYVTLTTDPNDEDAPVEIVAISGRSTDTLTISGGDSGRAQESTTAQAWTGTDSGVVTYVRVHWTAGAVDELQAAVNAIESVLSGATAVPDDIFIKFGTSDDFKLGYDEATNDRLEWRDSAGNVMTYLKDNGSTAIFGVNGLMYGIGSSAYNTTTPGNTYGRFHMVPSGTNDDSCAITWQGNNAGSPTTALAGLIMVQSSSIYGGKMYFATTASFGTGPVTRMTIDHNGMVGIGGAPISTYRTLVKGSGNSSSTWALVGQNSDGSSIFYARNDRAFYAYALTVGSPSAVETTIGNARLGGSLIAEGGSMTGGVSGTTRGLAVAYHGSGGAAAGCVKLYSQNGTPYWFWVTDAGVLRRHTALPTADTDGSAV